MPKRSILPFLLLALGLLGCGEGSGSAALSSDVSQSAETIASLAAGNEDLSTLVTALEAADLVATLDGEGPFTVFAPTNEAFAKLPEELLQDLLDDADALRDVLLYHVAAGELFAADVLASDAIPTALGPDISVQPEGPTLNQTVGLVATNIVASNGVVHLIDSVLIPPSDDDDEDSDSDDEDSDDEDSDSDDEDSDDEDSDSDDGKDDDDEDSDSDDGKDDDDEDSDDGKDEEDEDSDDDSSVHPLPTIVEIAASDDRFETLVSALELTKLDAVLEGDGPFTVFAPTDDAFDALPDGLLHELIANPDELANVLLYHVVPGNLLAADVVAVHSLTTALGPEITVQGDALTLNGDVNLLITDIVAKNGVIHVIDKVLVPPAPEPEPEPKSIVEIALEDERFTTLVEALQAAHLVEALEGEGPFTVFAPTNEAFAKLPKLLRKVLFLHPESLRNVLLYHVVPGDLASGDVLASHVLETLLGPEIRVDAQSATLNGRVGFVELDIFASNGVIHVIDSVLLPPLH